ncbi:MAG: hypothetical protein JOZ87_20375 [Chloroflexi bacterium]|nr:hypothetical protein [Chloroflexota bacterium]
MPGWKANPNTVALSIIVLATVAVVILGLRTDWLPESLACRSEPDCFPGPGETFSSIDTAADWLRTGPRYWLIEDLRNPQLDWNSNTPPSFYTHNLNLAAFVYYGFALLGVGIRVTGGPDGPGALVAGGTFPAVLVNIAAYAAGLWYAYALVRKLSGSTALALTFLLLLASEYFFSIAFALNGLRSWHWLGLFGTSYCALRAMERGRAYKLHAIAFLILALVSFGIGYDFFAIVATLTLATIGIYFVRQRTRPAPGQIGLFLSGLFVPFALRQVQIIGGLGFDFWSHDLLYSAAIKTSFLSKVVPITDLGAIDDWYAAHHVFRPPATPETRIDRILGRFVELFTTVWTPHLGWLAIGTVCVVFVGALAIQVAGLLGWRPAQLHRLQKETAAVLVISVGMAIGIAVFAPLSLEIYVKHAFPALIASVLLAYALAIVVFARWAAAGAKRSPSATSAIALTGCLALGVNHAYRQWSNLQAVPLMSMAQMQSHGPQAQFAFEPTFESDASLSHAALASQISAQLRVPLQATSDDTDDLTADVPLGTVDLASLGAVDWLSADQAVVTLHDNRRVTIEHSQPPDVDPDSANLALQFAQQTGVSISAVPGQPDQFIIHSPRGSVDLSKVGNVGTDLGYSVAVTLPNGRPVGFLYEDVLQGQLPMGRVAAQLSAQFGVPIEPANGEQNQLIIRAPWGSLPLDQAGTINFDDGYTVSLNLPNKQTIGLRYELPTPAAESPLTSTQIAERFSSILHVAVVPANGETDQFIVEAPVGSLDFSALGQLTKKDSNSAGIALPTGQIVGVRYATVPTVGPQDMASYISERLGVHVDQVQGAPNQYRVHASLHDVDLSHLGKTEMSASTDEAWSIGVLLNTGQAVGLQFPKK